MKKVEKFDIYKKFNNSEMEEIASAVIDRVMDADEDVDTWDKVLDAINDELIYTSDQWKIVEYYCTPDTADYDVAMTNFIDDIYSLLED